MNNAHGSLSVVFYCNQIPVDFTHILMGILPALGPDASDAILKNMVKYITPIRIDLNN